MEILRSYQSTCVDLVGAKYAEGFRRILLVAPTGAGKTHIFCHIVAKNEGARIYLFTHRVELVEQISRRLSLFGVGHGIIAPGFEKTDDPVQVCSIQSMPTRGKHLPEPDLAIVDECHHLPARTWSGALAGWKEAAILGVTATPIRLDGKGLATEFDVLVQGPSVRALIHDGFLSEYRIFAPPPKVNLAGTKSRAGDFALDDINERMNRREITGDAIEHYKQLASGRRAVVFCVTVQHARDVAEQFREAGVAALALDGGQNSTERKAAINGIRSGAIRVVTSCELISEGFDCPALEVAIILRPTKSLCVHLQQLGRVLRPAPEIGKTEAIILDHVGNVFDLGLPCEEREYSLEEGVVKKPQAMALKLRLCRVCYATYPGTMPVCPVCGATNTIDSRKLKQREGKLTELDKQELAQKRQREIERNQKEMKSARTRTELEALARVRGYKAGWVDIRLALIEKGERHG